jgi:hypothetical protein
MTLYTTLREIFEFAFIRQNWERLRCYSLNCPTEGGWLFAFAFAFRIHVLEVGGEGEGKTNICDSKSVIPKYSVAIFMCARISEGIATYAFLSRAVSQAVLPVRLFCIATSRASAILLVIHTPRTCCSEAPAPKRSDMFSSFPSAAVRGITISHLITRLTKAF